MYSENSYLSDVLLYEVLPKWSRQPVPFDVGGLGGDNIEVVVGGEVQLRISIAIGTVLGKVTSTGIYVPLDPTKNDGSQNAAGVLAENFLISDVPREAVVIRRGAGVNSAGLVWPADITPPQLAAAIAQLEALTIDVVSDVL